MSLKNGSIAEVSPHGVVLRTLETVQETGGFAWHLFAVGHTDLLFDRGKVECPAENQSQEGTVTDSLGGWPAVSADGQQLAALQWSHGCARTPRILVTAAQQHSVISPGELGLGRALRFTGPVAWQTRTTVLVGYQRGFDSGLLRIALNRPSRSDFVLTVPHTAGVVVSATMLRTRGRLHTVYLVRGSDGRTRMFEDHRRLRVPRRWGTPLWLTPAAGGRVVARTSGERAVVLSGARVSVIPGHYEAIAPVG